MPVLSSTPSTYLAEKANNDASLLAFSAFIFRLFQIGHLTFQV